MTLEQIIEIADNAYYDTFCVALCYEEPNENHGDTLAKFIATELKETYDPEASTEEQLNEAWHVISKASVQLAEVAAAFVQPLTGVLHDDSRPAEVGISAKTADCWSETGGG